MSQDKGIIAVDFGTTNSYFCKCPADQLSPIGIDFGSGRDGIPTAILYRQDKTPLIGNLALHEYGEATAKERKNYQLRTQFKPDIATSDQARTNAQDFLKTVLAEAHHQHIALEPSAGQTIFGVPSEASEDFKRALIQIASDSGFGDIRLLDEPKGALLNHLWRKDFSPSEAQQGVLVIDFGGGTCDFAYMQNLEVRHSWGDMELGGRLFDDLFFQWFADQNPEALDAIEQAGDFYYVYSYLCREAKEFFSQTMARDRSESVNKSIGRYGSLRAMTWDEFIQRSGQYRPSDILMRYLLDLGISLKILTEPRPTLDLLDWFKQSLQGGLNALPGHGQDVACVILAGGSSLWPFVADIVMDILRLKPDQLKRSDRPYAAISEGLSLLPALQQAFKRTQQNLQRDLPTFCQETMRPLIEKVTATYAEQIAADVTTQLFDPKIRPLLEDFREQGGSVGKLRERTELETQAFEAQLQAIVTQRTEAIKTGLPTQIKKSFGEWLTSYGLSLPGDSLTEGQGFDVDKDLLDRHLPDLYGDLVETVGWFVVAAMASLGASISGGAGMALLVSGPLGWLLGALLAGMVSLLAVRHGKDKAKQLAETWAAPAWMTQRLLSTAKIHRSREQFRSQIQEKLSQQCEHLHAEFQQRLQEVAQQQIDALSEISQL